MTKEEASDLKSLIDRALLFRCERIIIVLVLIIIGMAVRIATHV